MQSTHSMREMNVVLLPGLDGTGDLFAPLLGALPATINPLVMGYPTHESLDYAALAGRVRAALPREGHYVLLGESFSGPVAIMLAALQPRGLVGVILCATFATSAQPRLRWLAPLLRFVPLRMFAKLFLPAVLMGRFATPALRRLLRNALMSVSPGVLRMRVVATLTVDVTQELASLRVPVLYLRASEDHLLSRSACVEVVRAAPRARVADITGPHCLLQCVPETVAGVVEDFVESLD